VATSGVILFAEDDRRLRKLYTDALTASGYYVIAACDGEEALELLYGVRPKLILLDVMMPNLNGIETCRRARKIIGSEVPIVFLTALDQLNNVHECIEAGGDDYIMKSESVTTIIQRVGYWMRYAPRHKGLTARRGEMLAEVAAEISRDGTDARLCSETDESVREISHFLAEARSHAGDDFGKTVKEKLFLLGYVTGVVEHWAQLRGALEKRFFDYLSAVLRETGVLEDEEVFEMVSGFDELSADTSFGIARAHGRNDPAQRESQGEGYIPIGLRQFNLLAAS
jgi:DNA-binding response OmpR family regulator